MEKLISEIVFETQKCRIKLFPKFHERSLVLRELISIDINVKRALKINLRLISFPIPLKCQNVLSGIYKLSMRLSERNYPDQVRVILRAVGNKRIRQKCGNLRMEIMAILSALSKCIPPNPRKQ
ncbi:predicted protein [Botrytis cinerea T4]|uniref:Uncharacterized protein n=1 Tax=Botryotinia fuckeliana (strain T4) TaxID=999810 RepID=G2Y6R0_BOTF4|nr:predicted protein [Botrytis cinerea T4]